MPKAGILTPTLHRWVIETNFDTFIEGSSDHLILVYVKFLLKFEEKYCQKWKMKSRILQSPLVYEFHRKKN